MTKIEEKLKEAEERYKKGIMATDVPKLVQALRRAIKGLELAAYETALTDIAAILEKEEE